jgi:hypothetical protein
VPTVWGRGCGSNGYNANVSNHALPFTEVVPGTVSKTGCQLRTYIYKVYNTAGQYVGWYPYENSANAVFQYTAFIPYTAPSNASISGYYEPYSGSKVPAGYVNLSWGCTQGTIQEKYTLQIMEPYSTTGTWSNMFTTTATSYRYQHLPHTSGTGYRIIANDGKTQVTSNAVIIKPEVSGDPIVATVQSSEATAYSNGKKIVIDDTGTLHVTYTSGDTVYHTSSIDQGETWPEKTAVGLGANPAIGLRASESKSGELLPSICYVSGSGLMMAEKQEAGAWGQPQTVYQGQPDETISYLSFEIDRLSNSQYAGWVSSSPSGSLVNIAQGSPGGGQLAPTPIDQGGQTAFKSPSLALDRAGNLTVAWSRDGVVRFWKAGEGEIIELSQPGQNAIHPIVEVYGDRVSVVWQEQDENAKGLEPGRHNIVTRARTEYGWGGERVIASSETGDYQYPVAAAAGQYLYAGHHDNGDYDIHYLGEYANGWETHVRNISTASEGQSGYPCVAFSNKWPEHSLYILWTEAFPDSAKAILPPLVKSVNIKISPVPLYGIYPRTDQASAYCTQRAGGLCYGAGAYMTVDYHPEELKYRFEGLNPDNRYKAKMVFYRSTGSGNTNTSNNWLLMPKCDQVSFGTVHLADTTVVVVEREIPRQCLNDGAVDITVSKIKGEYAVCSALEIVEYNTGKGDKAGGMQETESGPMTLSYRYELLPSVPNPFNRTTAISYQLAKPGKVSLKVYNTLGQLVRTLEDGEKQAGHHRAIWDGKDKSGQKAANGVYLYRLEAGEFNRTKKMTLVR